MALGPTQPPIQWVPGALYLGVKRPVREADHSPPSSAEVKEWVELYLPSPSTPSWHSALLKHRGNFTFTFTFYSFVIDGVQISILVPGIVVTYWTSAAIMPPCLLIIRVIFPSHLKLWNLWRQLSVFNYPTNQSENFVTNFQDIVWQKRY
jgi:hypothetical protein